jgi:hypothetical protein
MARVTFNAAAEPANHVLMWLLNSLLGYGQVLPAQSPSYAYHVLYDPKLKYYMFNIVEVAAETATHTLPPPSAPPSGSNPFGNIKPKP